MRLFNRNSKCNHLWEAIYEKEEREAHYNGYNADFTYEKYVYIYCPSCKTRDKITHFEWTLRQKEQLIDHEYSRKLNDKEDYI